MHLAFAKSKTQFKSVELTHDNLDVLVIEVHEVMGSLYLTHEVPVHLQVRMF